MTITITIAREHAEPRYRGKLHTQPGGPAIFITARKSGSVAAAKREAESIFGPLDWREISSGSQLDDGYTRLYAALKLTRRENP